MMKRNYPKTFDVLVSNLPQDIQKENLQRLVSNVSGVSHMESISIVSDKKNENAKVAYLRFANEVDAETTVMQCKQMSLEGKTLAVRRANFGRERNSEDRWNRVDKQRDNVGRQRSWGFKESYDQPSVKTAVVSDSNAKEDKGSNMAEVVKEIKVMTTHVIGPTSFWGQNLEGNMVDNLFEMSEKLQIICPSSNAVAGPPAINKVYATKFSDDEQWYRCKVLRHIDDTKCEVVYMDYGNGECKENGEIVELPANLSTSEPFAQKFNLLGLISTADLDTMGYVEGQKELEKLIKDKMLTAKVCRSYSSAGEVDVILEDGKVDINQEMLDKGHAKTKLSQQKSNQRSENVQRADKQYEQRKFSGNIGTHSIDQFQVSKTLRENADRSNRGSHSFDHNGASDHSISETEILNLKREVEQLKEKLRQSENEKLDLTHEIRLEKNKIQTLCESYQQLNIKLIENDMSNKIKGLIDGVKQLGILRHQFPTDDDKCRDNIDYAIQMLSNKNDKSDLIDPAIRSKVDQTMKEYRLVQHDIRQCVNEAEFQTLIESRDQLRKSLHDSLVKFHQATSEINIEDRIDKLQDAMDSLLNTHKPFLKCESAEISNLQEAFSMYSHWKDRYLLEFKDIRTKTNTRHNAVDSCIQLLQQQLSLDVEGSTQNPSAIPVVSNLQVLCTKFQETIRIEMGKTNMLANKESLPLIGCVTKFLVNELKAELTELRMYQSLITDFQAERNQIEPWLNNKPDDLILRLQNLRKDIRQMKSKLRHKLADLCDVEENGGEVHSDFIAVKKAITDLRTQLQTHLLAEDQSLSQIPELCQKHFPELPSQYPELCLGLSMNHNGLVKVGWSLDQYDLDKTSIPRNSTLRTTFCGNPVVLKENLVGESFGISQEEFTAKVSAFSSISNPHLLRLYAVFFDQKNSLAFLQLPFCERNLSSVVKSGPVSFEWSLKVLGDVLAGLHALFEANLAHGAVHPDNVFINSNGRAVVAECDFLKTKLKAHERTFTSSNGLRFLPPEPFEIDLESMKARDLYNYGMLALWIHFPEVEIPLLSNGLPDTSALQLGEPLKVLLNYLVVPNAKERKTTDFLIKLPFFNNPFKAPSRENAESETLQLRCNSSPRDGSPTGGILKKSAKDGGGILQQEISGAKQDQYCDIENTKNPLSLFQEASNVLGQSPQFSKVEINSGELPSTDLNVQPKIEGGIQKSDFSPIVNSLPCTPMGTPENTPTEVYANSNETCGPSPRQNIVKTLQKVAELMVLDAGDQGLASLAKDETTRDSQAGAIDSDGTITEEDCDEVELQGGTQV